MEILQEKIAGPGFLINAAGDLSVGKKMEKNQR